MTFVTGAAVLVVAGLAAPALRAMRVHRIVALRGS